jgi:hypothetical protein
MKITTTKISVLFFAAILTLFFSCRKETNEPIIDNETTTVFGNTIVTSIGVEVVDENGNVITGADVKIGSTIKQTNSKGLILFRDISVNENKTYIKVEKNGFFLGSRNLMTRENSVSSVKIILLSNSSVGTFSSTTGGIVSHESVSLNFPANSIKIEGGGLYSGTVNAAIKFLDPNSNDIGNIMPGDLRALNSNEDEILLETFGMAAIELTSPTGQKLNVADGKTVELSIPLSGAYLADAPSSIPLWYFDEINGIWKEEGSATKVGNNYVGDVSHFTFWNCDNPNASTTISGTIKCNLNNVAGALIRISNTNGRVLGSTLLDNLGKFSGFIPINTSLIINVYPSNACNSYPIYSANIGPFNSPTTLPLINTCIGSVNTATLAGKLEDCNGNPITNGILTVDVNGIKSYFYPDAMGNINTSIIYCSSSTISLVAYDFTNIKSSKQQSFSTEPTINFGTISACDSINEYINYILDGIPYKVLKFSPDSVKIYHDYTQGTVRVEGIEKITISKRIDFTIRGSQVGTYPLTNILIVNNLLCNSQDASINVNITAYGDPGSFLTGNFSGTFIDLAGGTNHTLSGNFKIIKKN